LQFVNAEVRGQRVQDGQAAGQHGAAVGRRPGKSMRSAWPACRQRSMHQRNPCGVMRPSVWPAACSSCETAPAVPDEPRAWVQFWGAKGCRASSSSAPAATWAWRKPSRVMFPPSKKRIDRLTQPTAKLSATSGLRPSPRIISVERPPMSTTRRR
jgi:hypothetical protein